MKRYFDKNCTSVRTKNWRVDLVDLGEGLSGDYNPDDPADIPLLRFDVYVRQDSKSPWTDPGDASYCTRISSKSRKQTRKRMLQILISHLEYLSPETRIKKLCEELSWIGTDWK